MIRCFLEKARHVARHIHNVARVGRRLSHPRRVHRLALWRWVCVAAPPLVGVPAIGLAWGGLPTGRIGLPSGIGVGIPSGALTTVPEPNSAVLLFTALAITWVLTNRLRHGGELSLKILNVRAASGWRQKIISKSSDASFLV